MGQKNFLGQKIFWVKKIFESKKNLVQQFLVKNILGKKFLYKKIFGQKGRVNQRWRIYDPPPKNIVGLKILSQKNFGLIDLNPKFVLSKEKQVGLTQGG